MYLCQHLHSQYPDYNAENFGDVEFIPAETKDRTCLKKLGEVQRGLLVLVFLLTTTLGIFLCSVESTWLFRGTTRLECALGSTGCNATPSNDETSGNVGEDPPT